MTTPSFILLDFSPFFQNRHFAILTVLITNHRTSFHTAISKELHRYDAVSPGHDFGPTFDAIQRLRHVPPEANRVLKPERFRTYVALICDLTPRQVDILCSDVENGCKIGIDPVNLPFDLCQNPAHWIQTDRQAAFILNKFLKELQRAIIVPSLARPLYFINFFAVPKKGEDGKMSALRLIRNGSYALPGTFCINDFIMRSAYEIKTMPRLRSYAKLMHKRAYMAMRDLKDAFRQLHIRPEDHLYQGYCIFGQYYVDRHVAYGISSSAASCQRFVELICRIFNDVFTTNEFMDAAKIDISHCMDQICAYIDDFLLVADNDRDIQEMERRFDMLLASLGVNQSTSKAEHRRRKGVVHGWHWDLISQTVSIPPEKLSDFRSYLLWSITHRALTFGALQKINGKIFHYAQISPMAKLFAYHSTQAIYAFLKNRSRSRRGLRDQCLCLPISLVRSWTFWYLLAPMLSSAPISSLISQPSISWTGATDACTFGAGFFIGTHYASYLFTGTSQMWHITCKEAHVLIVMLQSLANTLTGHRIRIFMDNLTFVRAWAKRWSSSPMLMQCIWELLFYLQKYRIQLYLDWIPGELNTAADALSRFDYQRFLRYVRRKRLMIDRKPLTIVPSFAFRFCMFSNESDEAEMARFHAWLRTPKHIRAQRWWAPPLKHLFVTVPHAFD